MKFQVKLGGKRSEAGAGKLRATTRWTGASTTGKMRGFKGAAFESTRTRGVTTGRVSALSRISGAVAKAKAPEVGAMQVEFVWLTQ